MKSFAIHFLFDLKTGIRDKTLLLMNYIFPLGFYLAMGGIMPQLNPQYKDILIPSMIFFTLLVGTVLGMPNTLVTSRNNGIFRSYKINGIPKFSMLAIPTISTIFHTVIVTIIILISAPTLFDAKLPENIGALTLIFATMAIACSGLALLIGMISNNTSVTVIYAQVIFLPSMLIGGLMMPLDSLPKSIKGFSKLLPTTYAMDAFQSLVVQEKSAFKPVYSLSILLVTGVLSYLLASYFFRLDNNNTSKPKSAFTALVAIIPLALGALFL
ncbi:ABC transporter permease [Clostridium amazonitimonense]|uniref:ABC transporter permease n=1 Tax=Clostridium amazonitimonense TaxID=1499689 RepID=UPI0005099F3D|nr:ABC transporter permease [Clostridium amazonitimonense]